MGLLLWGVILALLSWGMLGTVTDNADLYGKGVVVAFLWIWTLKDWITLPRRRRRLRELHETLPEELPVRKPMTGTCARCGDLVREGLAFTLPDEHDYCHACLESAGGAELVAWLESRRSLPPEERFSVRNRPGFGLVLFNRQAPLAIVLFPTSLFALVFAFERPLWVTLAIAFGGGAIALLLAYLWWRFQQDSRLVLSAEGLVHARGSRIVRKGMLWQELPPVALTPDARQLEKAAALLVEERAFP